MADVHHSTIYFQGRVQGVGFRFAVLEVSRGYEVAGYVRNLTDGRVLVEAESEREEEISAFIAAIEEKMSGYIRKIERSEHLRAPHFKGFDIR